MKTAMQEHISELENMLQNEHYEIAKNAIRNCLICANSYLDEERMQIEASFIKGNRLKFYDVSEQEACQKYYNETFDKK